MKPNSIGNGKSEADNKSLDVSGEIGRAGEEFQEEPDLYFATVKVHSGKVSGLREGRREEQLEVFNFYLQAVLELAGKIESLRSKGDNQEVELMLAEQFANGLRRMMENQPPDVYLFMSYEKKTECAQRIDAVCSFIREVLSWDIDLPGYVRYDLLVNVATLQVKKDVPNDSASGKDIREFRVLTPDKASQEGLREKIAELFEKSGVDEDGVERSKERMRELISEVVDAYLANDRNVLSQQWSRASRFGSSFLEVSNEGFERIFSCFGSELVGKHLGQIRHELMSVGIAPVPASVSKISLDDLERQETVLRLVAFIDRFLFFVQQKELHNLFRSSENVKVFTNEMLNSNTMQVLKRIVPLVNSLLSNGSVDKSPVVIFSVSGLSRHVETTLRGAIQLYKSMLDACEKRQLSESARDLVPAGRTEMWPLEELQDIAQEVCGEFDQNKQQFRDAIMQELEAVLEGK